jgi:hypothetical protein
MGRWVRMEREKVWVWERGRCEEECEYVRNERG